MAVTVSVNVSVCSHHFQVHTQRTADLSDVIQALEVSNASVYAEDLLVDQRTKGEPVKHTVDGSEDGISPPIVDSGATLLVEAVKLVHYGVLVVAAEHEYAVWCGVGSVCEVHRVLISQHSSIHTQTPMYINTHTHSHTHTYTPTPPCTCTHLGSGS